MYIKRLIVTPIIFTIILTMSVFAQTSPKSYSSEEGTIEPLYAIAFLVNEVEIRVKSNGCTKAEDFKLESSYIQGQQLLTIKRMKKDRCRAMPRIVTIKLKLDNTHKDNVYDVVNRFRVMNK